MLFDLYFWFYALNKLKPLGYRVGWCQDNGNRSNQESKFDFLANQFSPSAGTTLAKE